MTKIQERKEGILNDFFKKAEEISVACSNGAHKDVESLIDEVKKLESQYFNLQQKEVFDSIENTHDALVQRSFYTLSHKDVKKDGAMVGIQRNDKRIIINMKDFCKHKGISLDWYYEMESLNKRIGLYFARELGCSKSEIKEMDDSYSFSQYAKDLFEKDKTPTSNNQLISHMQRVLDLLSKDEGHLGKSDLFYLITNYGKPDNKEDLKVMLAKHSHMLKIITDTFYRVAADKAYGVGYKKDKNYVPAKDSESKSKTAADDAEMKKIDEIIEEVKKPAKKSTKKAEKKAEPAA